MDSLNSFGVLRKFNKLYWDACSAKDDSADIRLRNLRALFIKTAGSNAMMKLLMIQSPIAKSLLEERFTPDQIRFLHLFTTISEDLTAKRKKIQKCYDVLMGKIFDEVIDISFDKELSPIFMQSMSASCC